MRKQTLGLIFKYLFVPFYNLIFNQTFEMNNHSLNYVITFSQSVKYHPVMQEPALHDFLSGGFRVGQEVAGKIWPSPDWQTTFRVCSPVPH